MFFNYSIIKKGGYLMNWINGGGQGTILCETGGCAYNPCSYCGSDFSGCSFCDIRFGGGQDDCGIRFCIAVK